MTAAGHNGGKTDILGKFHIYVADSLEAAIREAEPYLINYFDVHRAADLERQEQGLLTQRDARTQLEHGFVLAEIPSESPIRSANGATRPV
mgnify:CR=1 FL=1